MPVKTAATAETLLQILRYGQYPATLKALTAGSPRAQVVVGPLGSQALPLFVSLLFVNDVLVEQQQSPDEASDLLQLHLLLPGSVAHGCESELEQLLQVYNGLMPFGQWLLSDQRVSFRYRWQLRARDLDGLLLLEILEMLLFFATRLGPQLHAVASGQRPLADVLAQELDFLTPTSPSSV
jgi:hypothetical protein